MSKQTELDALDYLLTYFQNTGAYPSFDYMKKTYGMSRSDYNNTVKLNNKAVKNTGEQDFNTSSAGVTFDPRKGWAAGSNQKHPELTGEYADYTVRAHDMVSLRDEEIMELIKRTKLKGSPLTKDEVIQDVGKTNADNKYAYYTLLIDDNASMFGFNSANTPYSELQKNKETSTGTEIEDDTSMDAGASTEEENVDYNNKAMDKYWEDLFSLDQGTLGAATLNRLTTAEQNAALSNMQLADAQYQQASMQQAAVVKDIVDQVKAERNAKLRAGMSEAQIANQDMQIMLNNMNTMNQQMNTMNQNRLAAQQQHGLAQDTAYQAYLQNAQGLAQSGAAYSAANAGDPYYQALLYSMQTGKPFTTAHKNVVNGYNTQN